MNLAWLVSVATRGDKKEHDHANQTDLHRTAVGGGCGGDRRFTDGCCGNWADLLGKYCQSPGNVQINNAPAPVQYHPYGDMPFLLGGHGGLLGGLF